MSDHCGHCDMTSGPSEDCPEHGRSVWTDLARKVEREGRFQANAITHAMSYHRQEVGS